MAARRNTVRSVTAAAALSIAFASAVARADDWPTPGLDAAHRRLSAEVSGPRFSDARWSFEPPTAARAVASPVVADGFAVIAYLDGTVVGLHADSGAPAWQASVGSGVEGTPAISQGRVFVPTLGDKIVALALADGTNLWSTDVGGMVLSSPAVVNGDIIVAPGFPQRGLVRLDGSTGKPIWLSPPTMQPFSNTAPAVSGGTAVVGSNGGRYYAFDASSGAALWSYQADGVVHMAAPLIVGNRVYAAGGDDSDHVHAIDLATGAPVAGWPITLPAAEPDIAGTRIDRHRAVSSFAAAAGLVLLATRLDDSIDSDGDGTADEFLSRETLVAIDPNTASIVWQQPLGRAVFTDPNDVPKLFLCPTPAAFASAGGTAFVAAACSLAAKVTVFGAMGGNDAGDLTVAGRALASPVMANGRLVTVAESGVGEGQLSSVNHPPAAPILAATPHPLDVADVTLRWLAAIDPDAEMPTYELRIDSDGEVLQSFAQQIFPAQGASSAAIPGPLSPGVTYTWAVRARDPRGAYSPWSAAETFEVAASGPVTVDGAPAANLRAAVGAAQPGSIVALGAGTFPLAETLQVGPGVTLAGAGGGRTFLDGSGLAIAIKFGASDPAHATGLDRATVSGADTCIQVSAGATAVAITHVVAHGCASAAIAVAAGGGASIANATLVASGAAVDAAGASTIKNSLVTGNALGLVSESPNALTSSYDDLYANQTDYKGMAAGTGDLSRAVTFADAAHDDFHLAGPQASTDKGDPADDVGAEPEPNGARINLGAFAGTADAEPSAVSTAVIAGGAPASPTPTSTDLTDPERGCAIAGRPHAPGALALTLLALPAFRRRRRARTDRDRAS